MPAALTLASIQHAVETLVRVPSVNPAIAPDEGTGEAAVASAAQSWLTARGIRAWLEESAPGRPNVVAEVTSHVQGADAPASTTAPPVRSVRFPPTPRLRRTAVALAEAGQPDHDGPVIVLCAHLDTVGTTGMTIPPFEPRVEEGRLYGRGSFDMKGSAGAIMAVMSALEGSLPQGRVLAALVADEEHASLGAVDFVGRHAADACIVTEPSDGTLVLAHKGFVWVTVRTTGRAAHGSRFDLGVSAIGRMGRIIAAIEQFDREELRRRTHPLVGPASMHCALVSGGAGLTTYAPECTLQIERRTLPGEDPEEVTREIASVIAAAGESADVVATFSRPGLTCDRDSAVATAVRDAARTVTGHEPSETGVGYWMDAAIFAAAGIPTVNYGPGGAGAHEPSEWVDLASLDRCAKVLYEAVVRFVQGTVPKVS